MLDHKHESFGKIKKDGKIIGCVAIVFNMISIALFSFKFINFGFVTLSIALAWWVVFLSFVILLQGRANRMMLAKIHNVPEFYGCPQCEQNTLSKEGKSN